jgi:hypothetical protein
MGLYGDDAPPDTRTQARGPCTAWFAGKRVWATDGVIFLDGTVISSDGRAMSITIEGYGGRRTPLRVGSIQRLLINHRHRRTGAGALVGAIIGAVAGGAIACAGGCSDSNDMIGPGRGAAGASIGLLIGVVAGAVIGHVVVSDRWSVVVHP